MKAMNKGIWIITGILLFAVISIIVIMQKPQEPDVYKIGGILALTGSSSLLGSEAKEGIDIAVAEINNLGGVNSRRIKVIFVDSQNKAKEGISAFRQLIALYKPAVVITQMSSVSNAIVPIADQMGVPIVGINVAAPSFPRQSKWAFRNYYNTDKQGETIAKFMINEILCDKIGVLYLNDDYGRSGYEVLKQHIEDLGRRVIWAESYDKEATDIRSILFKLKEHDPDAVCIIAYDRALAIAIKQMREAGLTAKIFTYTGLANPKVIEQAGAAAEGAYLAAGIFDPKHPVSTRAEMFITKYKEQYGRLPSHYPLFGYDTVQLIAEAIRRQGYTPTGIREGLLSIADFPLLMGNITVLQDGEILFSEKVKMIRNGQIVEVDQENQVEKRKG